MIEPGFVKYKKHALLQMERRNIYEEEVLGDLNDPDEFKKNHIQTRQLELKGSEGRELEWFMFQIRGKFG